MQELYGPFNSRNNNEDKIHQYWSINDLKYTQSVVEAASGKFFVIKCGRCNFERAFPTGPKPPKKPNK